MKPVFKCDYCSKMGTEEEIREHEPKCIYNYDRKSCYTCANSKPNWKSYECNVGQEIPEGCIIEFCDKYESKENNNTLGAFGDIFGGLFGR